MSDKNRKLFLICIGVIVASYFVRGIVISALQMRNYEQQMMRQQATRRQKPKPVPVKPAPAAPKPAKAPKAAPRPVIAAPLPKPAPPSPFARLPGIWRGRVALEGRGICDLKFELTQNPESADRFSGYSTMTCNARGPLMAERRSDPRKLTLNQMDPEAAIFSGAAENGSLQFHAEKVVGTDSNGCAPASLSLTPFGANQLAAEWQETTCAGGHMILRKARQ
jgi:hypothetical protein